MEYLIGTENGLLQCRTVKRRAEYLSYDPECVNYIKITHADYVVKGARTTQMVKYPSRPEEDTSSQADCTSSPPTTRNMGSPRVAVDVLGRRISLGRGGHLRRLADQELRNVLPKTRPTRG